MHTVSQVMARKQANGKAEVATITPDEPVLLAAKKMNDRRIGALVVCNDEGGVEGIITERDLLQRVVAAERCPKETTTREVMTSELLMCGLRTQLDEARELMRDQRIRHLPIVENGALIGMVSMGDLNAAESENLAETVSHLESYIRSA